MEYVCIYNRCSTEEEAQVNALAIQAAESREIVEQNPDWKLVAQYVEAQSATSSRKRSEYRKMIEGIEAHRFTLVVIKSIDRLMRNVKDWYLFLDCITRNRVRLYMYLEHKFYDSEDSLLTGIKAILAEDFSRELSKKIKNAHRRRQEKRSGYNITREMFGWNCIGRNQYERNEVEAGWYRQAFLLAERGYGYRRISNTLYEMGARSRTQGKISAVQWRNMLLSPRAHGTMVIHKTEYDFARKKKEQIPEESRIEIENALPEIVSKEYHRKVIALLEERATKRKSSVMRNPAHIGCYDLSGKLVCGVCHKTYYRVKSKGGLPDIRWKCSSYLTSGTNAEKGGCRNIVLRENTLCGLLATVNEAECKQLQEDVIKIIKWALRSEKSAEELRLKRLVIKNREKSERLLDKFLDGIVSEKEYCSCIDRLKKEEALLKESLFLYDEGLNADSDDIREENLRRSLEERQIIVRAKACMELKRIREIKVFGDSMLRVGYWGEEEEKLIQYEDLFSASHKKACEQEKIKTFLQTGVKISVSEMSRKLEMKPQSLYRLLYCMEREGIVRRNREKGVVFWELLS